MKHIVFCLIAFFGLLTFAGCSGEYEDVNEINQQTLLVYMPWSGSETDNGLYNYFTDNIDSINAAVAKAQNNHGRVLLFISDSPSHSTLYDISSVDGNKLQTEVKTYEGSNYTSAEGITQVLNDVKEYASGLNYAMIIGSHGNGWLYKDDWSDNALQAKTRFFGSASDADFMTDITELAKGIEGAGIKMQYVLFDDCYMANVETAYELRNATNFLLGSTSETMAVGMPYKDMWRSLASSAPSYSNIVSTYTTFIKNYTDPYGTFSVIDCRKLDRVAQQMKLINARYTLADSLVDSLQVLDGYKTPIFYDMGDYVEHLCQNEDMLNDFESLLSQAVKASMHTDSIYSMLYNEPHYKKVSHFSGLTISDPSKNPAAIAGRKKTAWYRDTH